MNKADRNLLISIGIIAVIFIGGYASLVAYTGFSTPFSIVMSQSMQHDPHQSEIGSIDTGDIVIVMDPSKADIQSYIDGTKSGYTSFGDYGSVIIYNRGDNQNPVIHRAIIWLEYNPVNDTWSAPSLNGYDGSWYCQYFDEVGSFMLDPENSVAAAFTATLDQDILINPKIAFTYPTHGVCYSRDIDSIFSSLRFPLDDAEFSTLEQMIFTFVESSFQDISPLQRTRTSGIIRKIVDDLNEKALTISPESR